MTTDNFVRALKPFTRRKPFRPFVVEFITGEQLVVTHPELVSIDGELFVHVDPKHRYRVFDSTSICQILDLPAK